MSKPAYNIGDLVAAEDDNGQRRIVIGWISDYDEGVEYRNYLVDWADGEQDKYSEGTIATFRKLLDKTHR
jgi:hypothetical protein